MWALKSELPVFEFLSATYEFNGQGQVKTQRVELVISLCDRGHQHTRRNPTGMHSRQEKRKGIFPETQLRPESSKRIIF